jgi:hypothetical protein
VKQLKELEINRLQRAVSDLTLDKLILAEAYARQRDDQVIQRRRVYFVGGYHPLNMTGYHSLFRRQLERFKKLWGVDSKTTSLLIADDGMSGSWDCETVGPNWTVTTNYVVLRWDDLVSSDMKRGIAARTVAIARMLFSNIVNGQLASLFRINWRFALAYLYPIFGLLIATSAPFTIGASVGYATYRLTESPIWSISL